MRENRTCGSEGGEALRLPYPYEPVRSEFRRSSRAIRLTLMPLHRAM
jgi:hypothetical protein